MKDFLERNTMLVTGIAVAAVVLAVILGMLLVGARDLQLETQRRIDKPDKAEEMSLGRKGQISTRSKTQLEVVLSETPHVVGGWVTKLNYGKTEVPILHYWARDPLITDFIDAFSTRQKEGRGNSSEELNAKSEQSLRNSEEAKTGLIKCGPLESTNLLKIEPKIAIVAKGVCRATVPPFDENVNLAIVVLIDVDAEVNSPEVQAVRRALLQLQIDIYNRDYQGRETWARPL